MEYLHCNIINFCSEHSLWHWFPLKHPFICFQFHFLFRVIVEAVVMLHLFSPSEILVTMSIGSSSTNISMSRVGRASGEIHVIFWSLPTLRCFGIMIVGRLLGHSEKVNQALCNNFSFQSQRLIYLCVLWKEWAPLPKDINIFIIQLAKISLCFS